jgi:O-methyltransferase
LFFILYPITISAGPANGLFSLKTNKPVEAAEEGDISATTIFDNAKSNQAIEQMQMFTRAMYGVSVGPAMALGKVFDFSNYKKMMDIGGGSGAYAIEVVKAHPNMSAGLHSNGLNIALAITLIKRLKELCMNPASEHQLIFDTKETVLVINGCLIQAFPFRK